MSRASSNADASARVAGRGPSRKTTARGPSGKRRQRLPWLGEFEGLARRLSEGSRLADGAVHHATSVWCLRALALRVAEQSGMAESVQSGRLLAEAQSVQGHFADAGAFLDPDLHRFVEAFVSAQPGARNDSGGLTEHSVGVCHETLLAHRLVRQEGSLALTPGHGRKRSGSYFTPPKLAREVVRAALGDGGGAKARVANGTFAVLDPAMGAGVFLIECALELRERFGVSAKDVASCLHGVDQNPLSVAVAEICVWLSLGEKRLSVEQVGRCLRTGESLLGVNWETEFPDVFEGGGFDAVVGNPPWVAFAGRAAEPLADRTRKAYRARFHAFRGYPTLHGLFVERAVRLAPSGSVALLLPSPVSDLGGYAAVREAATQRHVAVEPLLEHGHDAFVGVAQPSFTLLLRPSEATATRSGAPFKLLERARAQEERVLLAPPAVLARLSGGPTLPPEIFREMGFQSTGVVSRELFHRGDAPTPEHNVPLLEGRNVKAFQQGKPRLFLKLDEAVMKRSKCKLRGVEQYRQVDFVVRQTAAYPIAALHGGDRFRNSLLAGFEHESFSATFLVGLLNSTLYRAIHVANQRDGRQAIFPQVKISHLRRLPAPPVDFQLKDRIEGIVQRLNAMTVSVSLLERLDDAVFDLFKLSLPERTAVRRFFEDRTGK